jgi:hypothetical protein
MAWLKAEQQVKLPLFTRIVRLLSQLISLSGAESFSFISGAENKFMREFLWLSLLHLLNFTQQ